jgi:pyridoxal phosphate enzyme (YggS family)
MLSTPQIPTDIALAGRLQAVRARIEAAAIAFGRATAGITLLAVSKGQPVQRLQAAVALGLTEFGENYVNEAVPKIKALAGHKVRWHFIGRIQANKTRLITTHFDWVHGIDRIAVAQRLSEQRDPQMPPLNVCVQINIMFEQSKGGCAVASAAPLLDAISALPNIKLRGLMCMLPYAANEQVQHDGFGRMRKLFEQTQRRGIPLDTLSMGMSDDLEAAVVEGTTLLRIGTALFGPRPKPPSDLALP